MPSTRSSFGRVLPAVGPQQYVVSDFCVSAVFEPDILSSRRAGWIEQRKILEAVRDESFDLDKLVVKGAGIGLELADGNRDRFLGAGHGPKEHKQTCGANTKQRASHGASS